MKRFVLSSLLVLGCCLLSATAQVLPQASGTVEVRIVNPPETTWTKPETVLAILGVVGGFTGVLIQRLWHRRDEKLRAKHAERDRLLAHVLDSLKWFEGKTQRRSIGIAVIEGNWDKFEDLQPTWVAVLMNQAVYLLTESNQEDAAHESENLKRIMMLLRRGVIHLTPEENTSLKKAIMKNVDGKGLRGIDDESLRHWLGYFS